LLAKHLCPDRQPLPDGAAALVKDNQYENDQPHGVVIKPRLLFLER
jgi:hypothetical protein